MLFQNSPLSPFQSTFATFRKPISETNGHCDKQAETKDGGAVGVMIGDSVAVPDLVDSPKIQAHAVEETEAGDDGEGPGRGEGDVVAEVEEGGGDTT